MDLQSCFKGAFEAFISSTLPGTSSSSWIDGLEDDESPEKPLLGEGFLVIDLDIVDRVGLAITLGIFDRGTARHEEMMRRNSLFNGSVTEIRNDIRVSKEASSSIDCGYKCA